LRRRAIPATLAGVDGLVSKAAPASELYDAIRRVVRGERVLPPISRELLEAANAELEPEELPILGMTLELTPAVEMADAARCGAGRDLAPHRPDDRAPQGRGAGAAPDLTLTSRPRPAAAGRAARAAS